MPTTMDYQKTMQALKSLRVETGSLACFGCGHEHNCSTQGCAILRNAVGHMEAALERATLTPPNEWVSVEERLPDKYGEYIVCACDEGGPIDEQIWGDTVVVFADYYDGTFAWYEGNREYDISDIVAYWMPLPAPPDRRPPEGEEDT